MCTDWSIIYPFRPKFSSSGNFIEVLKMALGKYTDSSVSMCKKSNFAIGYFRITT